ncbi:ThiF family adenylyltransferase [Pelomonas sp. V22]|uniref:ThiF family adenylyltransferase n=1 Tax=Pelomonas sp. V22 TaxID=2822139 RepID=UPI0024A8CAAD|nr:ThiF family adenylyltransferase [Pelomonas sp. V22]MDI4631717.1 ThiF family adenylyltransferase [Pelomonas sp. V22]
MQFDYARAFSRNIGWVTEAEQAKLRNARVAIAGMGGVGGKYVETLARLGVGKLVIADFDEFDLHNMNRQAGSFMSTMGQSKLEVMSRIARDINPEMEIRAFPHGVNAENVDEFLEGVDIYADALDVFALDIRRMVFAKCKEKHIPALTAAPLGMGTAFLYFDPAGMSFEDYFKLEGHEKDEQLARFIVGLSPAMLNRSYLVDPTSVNFGERRGPSTPMACALCGGVMGSAVLKLMLGRGKLRAAPWSMQFDAYRQKLTFNWRPWGNANPLQQLLLLFVRPLLRGQVSRSK